MFSNDRLLAQIVLLSLLGACLWVLTPFISALFWAAVLAFASWPLMQFLTRVFNNNESLAAGVLTSGWVVVLAGPLIWLGFNIADHIRTTTELIKNLRVTGLPDPPEWMVELPMIGDRLLEIWMAADEQGAAFFATIKPYMG